MVDIKTKEEIELMAYGGNILSDVLFEVLNSVKPGMTEIEADAMADRLIKERGGEPAFKRVRGYKYATCISTNNVVVHGIPSDYAFKEGDVLGIDCGVFYKGFNTDMSHSIIVGDKKDPENVKFLEIGEKALWAAIDVAIAGNRIGNISKTIQDIVEGEGYGIVRSLIGHGVGRKLHEEPEVPGYLTRKIEKTPVLEEGMTIAVEIIYNMGDSEVSFLNNDGWTIASTDGSISGLYERTIAIQEGKPLLLTK